MVWTGFEFTLGTENDALTLRTMRENLIRWYPRTKWPDADGASRVPTVFFATRSERWSVIAPVVSVLQDSALQMHEIRLEVLRWSDPEASVVLGGRIATQLPSATDLELRLTARGDGTASRVALEIGGGAAAVTIQFPAGRGLERRGPLAGAREPWFDAANQAWVEAEDVFSRVATEGMTAALHIPDAQAIEYAYIVAVIDLLQARGVLDLSFPDQGFRIIFRQHTDEPFRHPAGDGGDLPILLAAIVGLLAFGLPLLGLRRGRRR